MATRGVASLERVGRNTLGMRTNPLWYVVRLHAFCASFGTTQTDGAGPRRSARNSASRADCEQLLVGRLALGVQQHEATVRDIELARARQQPAVATAFLHAALELLGEAHGRILEGVATELHCENDAHRDESVQLNPRCWFCGKRSASVHVYGQSVIATAGVTLKSPGGA